MNAKRYTVDGEEEATGFSEEDNLILKGNNLLALHSIKGKYAGKVKQIYIEMIMPPMIQFNRAKRLDIRTSIERRCLYMKAFV